MYLETKDKMNEGLAKGVAEQTTVKGKLRQLFYNAIFWSIQHPAEQLFFHQFSHSPFISQITKDEGLQRFQFIYNLLESGQKSDVLKSAPVELVFDATEGMLNGIIKHLLNHPQKIEDEEFTETAFNLLWNSIKD